MRHFLFSFFIVLGWEVVVFLTGEPPKQGYKSSEECEDVDYKMGSHPTKLQIHTTVCLSDIDNVQS